MMYTKNLVTSPDSKSNSSTSREVQTTQSIQRTSVFALIVCINKFALSYRIFSLYEQPTTFSLNLRKTPDKRPQKRFYWDWDWRTLLWLIAQSITVPPLQTTRLRRPQFEIAARALHTRFLQDAERWTFHALVLKSYYDNKLKMFHAFFCNLRLFFSSFPNTTTTPVQASKAATGMIDWSQIFIFHLRTEFAFIVC